MAQEFAADHVIETMELQHIPGIACHCTREIVVYVVSGEGFFALRGHFFSEGEEEQKAPPPRANDHWDLLKTRFSYHRSKLAIFCVTEKGAQTDKPKPSARAQTFGPQHPYTKELSILEGITAKPPVVGSRTKAKCAEYISITSRAATEAKGSLPATVLMVITQEAASCFSSRAVISTAAPMLPRT